MPTHLSELEDYVRFQLEDPRYNDVGMDELLDIVSLANKRLETGAYHKRVLEESKQQVDDFLLVWLGFKEK